MTKLRKIWWSFIVAGGIASSLAILFLAVLIGYWTFYPYDPIDVQRIELDRYTASIGDEVCYTIIGRKLLPIRGKIVVELINGEAIQLMTIEPLMELNKPFKPRCFIVPETVRPNNEYRVRWTGGYQPNPVRIIEEQYYSNPIIITEKKVKK
jgi:hypothetical protein